MAEEQLANLRTVRAFAQELREFEKYKLKITDVLNLSYKEALATGVFFGFVSAASTGASSPCWSIFLSDFPKLVVSWFEFALPGMCFRLVWLET